MTEINELEREVNVGGQRTAETSADDITSGEAVTGARGGLNRLLLLAALVVSSVSCSKEEPTPVQDFVAGPTEAEASATGARFDAKISGEDHKIVVVPPQKPAADFAHDPFRGIGAY